jgi:hypothetical protein
MGVFALMLTVLVLGYLLMIGLVAFAKNVIERPQTLRRANGAVEERPKPLSAP